MKPFRIYEYESGRMMKPVRNRPVRHDYDSAVEAFNAGEQWAKQRNIQVILIHYTGNYESRIMNIIENV